MSESDHCVVVSDQIGYGLHGKVGSSTIIMYFQTTMGGTNTVVICTVWCIIYHIIICSSRRIEACEKSNNIPSKNR